MLTSISAGPINMWRQIETNAERASRDIIWKARPLRGVRSIFTTVFSSAIDPIVNMHWGVQIGPYLYEVGSDKATSQHLIFRRISINQPEFWRSVVPDKVVGQTSLTDEEINACGKET
jgi:hypothetical protein